MSAAVAQRNSPHMPRPASRTNSPMDSKRTVVNSEDLSKKDPPPQSTKHLEHTIPPRSDPPTTIKQPPDQDESRDSKPASNAETTQPLAPPPRPAPAHPNTVDTPDYFSSVHNSSHFSLEPNPFEQSFGNPSSETPGKSLLPPVAALTSPAPLLGGASSASGYNWTNSLRSGPLSPAMLSGPTGGDYFDGHLRGGFPTPNESSLRTGLTPGGGGSMFPAASPNSQALYQQLANGGATPGTLDFHRTAMTVAAARKTESYNHMNGATSQPQEQKVPIANMDQSTQQQQQQSFGQHDNDAANGLFMLAQAGNGTQQNNRFAIPNPPSTTHAHPSSLPSKSHETSPNLAKRAARNASIGGSISDSARGVSEMSGEMSDDGETQAKPNTRGKGKRNSTGKSTQPPNGRRKAEETPSKGPAAKKLKTTNEAAHMDLSMDGMDSDEENIKEEQYNENGKKMTDEEKRKNFLERNRVAALKCRQRKKQWLANLQAKVEIFSSENDALSAQVTQLREEIVNLKTILLAHKDCPVSQAQGISNYASHNMPGDYNNHANPYGMAMQNGQVMAGQGIQRS